MKKKMNSSAAWLVAGLVTLILAGVLGDHINPHPSDLSLRTLSGYLAALVMLIAAWAYH